MHPQGNFCIVEAHGFSAGLLFSVIFAPLVDYCKNNVFNLTIGIVDRSRNFKKEDSRLPKGWEDQV